MCDTQPFRVANSGAAICCVHAHIPYSGLFSRGIYFTFLTNSNSRKIAPPKLLCWVHGCGILLYYLAEINSANHSNSKIREFSN